VVDLVVGEYAAFEEDACERFKALGRENEVKPGAAADVTVAAAFAGLIEGDGQHAGGKLGPTILLDDKFFLEAERIAIKVGAASDIGDGNFEKLELLIGLAHVFLES
jgi:hypothetical protein